VTAPGGSSAKLIGGAADATGCGHRSVAVTAMSLRLVVGLKSAHAPAERYRRSSSAEPPTPPSPPPSIDRLLHRAHTVLIEGSSYRMKDRVESAL
jgi:hypothetical protein